MVFDIRQPGVHITWSWLLVPVEASMTRLVLRIKGRLDIRLPTMPLIALLDSGEFASAITWTNIVKLLINRSAFYRFYLYFLS
jgi:hypothetical protein